MRGLVVPFFLLAACVLAELDSPNHYSDTTSTNDAGYDIETSYHSAYYNPVPLITKNVYVHVAPEEPQVSRQQNIVAPSQPRQRYKIVFIKAPSQPPPAGAHIQLPRQDEEKTLIYVLTKKQDEQASIQIQEPAPTKPSKPEIYFIRYKTQKSSSYGPGPGTSGQGISPAYGPPSH